MTAPKGPTTTHSGKRYTFTPATKIYRLEGRIASVRYKGLEAGCWLRTWPRGKGFGAIIQAIPTLQDYRSKI